MTMTCAHCGDLLTAPEGSEYVNEQHLINHWSCSKCGCRFKSEAYVPADAVPMDGSAVIKAFFPPKLVA